MSRAAECVFLAQNEAGGLSKSDEIQSESVHMLSVENIQRMLKKYSKNIQSESVHQLSVENIQRMERNFEKVAAAGKLTDS